jgi:acetolactate synthase-1/2/3 large subunit
VSPLDAVPPDLAPLFAEAHRRLGGDRAVSDQPVSDRWQPAADEVVERIAAATVPVILAGPGVVVEGAVPGLHAVAAAGSVGVLNTWGAKGVFDWRSRHHLATVGLQALDFERGGLAGADLIIATGIDEREARAPWRLAPVVEVAPGALDPLAERWSRPRTEIPVPPLRADLARITQAGWERAAAPLAPTRATRHYGLVLGAGGLVAADPGIAGYWVARTFATTVLGGAQVPGDGAARGFAIAAAVVARLAEPHRPVLAVVDALDDVHGRLLEIAERVGVDVAVEVWAADGEPLDAEAHLNRLRGLVAGGGRATLATDTRQIGEMLAVAGDIVAWT